MPGSNVSRVLFDAGSDAESAEPQPEAELHDAAEQLLTEDPDARMRALQGEFYLGLDCSRTSHFLEAHR